MQKFFVMSKTHSKKGLIVIVSGPSGAGKSTICSRIIKELDDTCLSVSVTTRPIGKSETNGKDYLFISKDEFQERIDKGLLLEYAKVFGNMYGTPRDKVEEMLDAGKTVILEIDVQGGRQVKKIYPDAVMIFILPPDVKTLSERIGNRDRDSSESVELRLDGANTEIAAAKQYYEHMVVNEDLDTAVNDCLKIIRRAIAKINEPAKGKHSKQKSKSEI